MGVVSAFDYWDHISRPGDSFGEAPVAWLAFTLAATVTLWIASIVSAKLLGRTGIPQLVADTLGMGLAIALHLLVTGPLWDRVFWTGQLYFDAVVMPVLVACALYLLFRGAFAGVSRWFVARAASR